MPAPFSPPLLGIGMSLNCSSVTGVLLPADQTYLFVWNPEYYLLSQNSLSLSKTTCHFLFGFRYQLLAYHTACCLSVCPPNGRFACPVLLQLTLCPLSAGPRPPQNSSQACTISLEQDVSLYNWSEEQCNPWDQTQKSTALCHEPLEDRS